MPNASTPVPVKANDDPAPVPNANLWREELGPRHEAKVRDNLRAAVHAVVHGGASVLDTTYRVVQKQLTEQAWTERGAQDKKFAARMEAEGMLDITATSATAQARDHHAQLQAELSFVPEPANGFAAWAIWQKLDAMPAADRNMLLARTDDSQIVSAVFHAPAVFDLGDDDARQRMLTNYNRRHRAQQFALADDLGTFIAVVDDIVEGMKRDLRGVLR
jgi:hypothetical protein